MGNGILSHLSETERFTSLTDLMQWAAERLSSYYDVFAGFVVVFHQEKRAEIVAAHGGSQKSFLSGISLPLHQEYTTANLKQCFETTFHAIVRQYQLTSSALGTDSFLVIEDSNLDVEAIQLFVLYVDKTLKAIDLQEKISLQNTNYQVFDKLRILLSQTENALSEALPILGNLLQAEGIVVKLANNCSQWGETPSYGQIEMLRNVIEDNISLVSFWHTHSVCQVVPSWHSCKRFASGVLWATFQDGELIAFRPERTKVIRWATRPHYNNDIPAVWTQTISGESNIWTTAHLQCAEKIVALLQDSYRLQRQNELSTQTYLRHFLKFTHEWVLVISDDDEIKFANDAFYQATGTTSSDAVHLLAYLHIDDILTLLEDLSTVRKGIRTVSHLEFRVIGQDGEVYYLSGIATRLCVGNWTNTLINARDISSDIRRNQNLIRFKTAINASTNAIVVLKQSPSKEWLVVYTNNAYAKLIGKKTNQIIGKPFDLFAEQEVWEAKNLQQHIEEGKNYNTFLRYQNSDAKIVWLQCQFSFMHVKDAAPSCIVIMNDVTEFRQAEEKMRDYSEKLRISNEELQTFAYVASHDLQEPLRTISGFSELIAEKLRDSTDEETKEYLQFMLEATARMKNLIRDLLKFSRLTTQTDYLAEVSLTIPLENAIKNLHSAIEATKATITYSKMPTLLVNETLMLQLFQNLLSNAIKYRKQDTPPQISIEACEEENYWVFSIRDNGIGIEERFFDRIFVIFQRLHTKEQYSGTGIGLAICRKIVEKHGGKIWLTSKAGEGSTFYFSLPKIHN